MTPVKLPKAGMGIEEGTVLQWLKIEGQRVEKGESLVEIETAKAVQEVAVPVSGKLSKILVDVGQTVAVHTDIALIDEDDL